MLHTVPTGPMLFRHVCVNEMQSFQNRGIMPCLASQRTAQHGTAQLPFAQPSPRASRFLTPQATPRAQQQRRRAEGKLWFPHLPLKAALLAPCPALERSSAPVGHSRGSLNTWRRRRQGKDYAEVKSWGSRRELAV